MKTIIHTSNAPQAIGPYSQAVVSNKTGLVFVSGQLGINPATGDFVSGNVSDQARQALLNLTAILQEAGSDLSCVVKTTVYLYDMADFGTVNAVYAEFFKKDPPARAAIQVACLPKDALVEIEAIAELTE